MYFQSQMHNIFSLSHGTHCYMYLSNWKLVLQNCYYYHNIIFSDLLIMNWMIFVSVFIAISLASDSAYAVPPRTPISGTCVSIGYS